MNIISFIINLPETPLLYFFLSRNGKHVYYRVIDNVIAEQVEIDNPINKILDIYAMMKIQEGIDNQFK